MAVKTITIDMEAYEILSRHKKPGQSFSEVIKEKLRGRGTGGDLKTALEDIRLADDTLDAIDAQIRQRARRTKKPVRL